MTIAHLAATCERIAGLGLTKATLHRRAEAVEGGPSRPAWVRLETSIERPANVGGGTVGWTLYVDPAGNPDHTDKLNSLLSLLCDAISETVETAALVRNAWQARADARKGERRAEARLARVLDGRRIRGRFLVQQDDVRGGVWLLDPEKGPTGFGWWFESLDALWRAHPDLRPVAWDNGGLLVEPWAYGRDNEPSDSPAAHPLHGGPRG